MLSVIWSYYNDIKIIELMIELKSRWLFDFDFRNSHSGYVISKFYKEQYKVGPICSRSMPRHLRPFLSFNLIIGITPYDIFFSDYDNYLYIYMGSSYKKTITVMSKYSVIDICSILVRLKLIKKHIKQNGKTSSYIYELIDNDKVSMFQFLGDISKLDETKKIFDNVFDKCFVNKTTCTIL